MKVKDYSQYVKEEFGELFKMYFIYSPNSIECKTGFKNYVGKNFMIPITEKTLTYQLNQKYPIVNYNNDITRFLIKNKLIPLKNIYNKPDDIQDVSSKVKFHQIMKDSIYVPKTVFSKEDALEKLNFPIIAKPDNKHSGIGIQFFKLKSDLKESEDKFDVFSEYKKIDEEFRIIFFKDKPILFMQRKPLNDKAKDGKGEIDKEMVFVYHKINLGIMPNKFNNIIKEVREKFKNVDFYALDLMKDINEELFIIEINSQPGIPFDVSVNLYKMIYEDFYKKELSSETLVQLDLYANELNLMTVQDSNNHFTIDN